MLAQAQQPRVLPCGHCLCCGCLERLYEGAGSADEGTGGAACPFDRRPLRCRKGAVPVCYPLVALLAHASTAQSGDADAAAERTGGDAADAAAVRCCYCAAGASHSCATCDDALCGFHAEAHARTSTTASHVLVAGTPVAPPARKMCDTHTTEDLRFFCEECNVAVCRDCICTAHGAHRIADLSVAADAALTELDAGVATARERAMHLGAAARRIELAREGLKRSVDEAEALVRHDAEAMKEAIDAQAARFVSEIRRKCERRSQAHTATLHSLKHAKSNLSAAVDAAVRAAEARNSIGIVNAVEVLRVVLGDTASKPTDAADAGAAETGDKASSTAVLALPKSGTVSRAATADELGAADAPVEMAVQVEGLMANVGLVREVAFRSATVVLRETRPGRPSTAHTIVPPRDGGIIGGAASGGAGGAVTSDSDGDDDDDDDVPPVPGFVTSMLVRAECEPSPQLLSDVLRELGERDDCRTFVIRGNGDGSVDATGRASVRLAHIAAAALTVATTVCDGERLRPRARPAAPAVAAGGAAPSVLLVARDRVTATAAVRLLEPWFPATLGAAAVDLWTPSARRAGARRARLSVVAAADLCEECISGGGDDGRVTVVALFDANKWTPMDVAELNTAMEGHRDVHVVAAAASYDGDEAAALEGIGRPHSEWVEVGDVAPREHREGAADAAGRSAKHWVVDTDRSEYKAMTVCDIIMSMEPHVRCAVVVESVEAMRAMGVELAHHTDATPPAMLSLSMPRAEREAVVERWRNSTRCVAVLNGTAALEAIGEAMDATARLVVLHTAIGAASCDVADLIRDTDALTPRTAVVHLVGTGESADADGFATLTAELHSRGGLPELPIDFTSIW